MHSRAHEGRKYGGSTGNGGNGNSFRYRRFHERVRRIGYSRSSRVGNEGTGFSFFQRLENLIDFRHSRVRVERNHRAIDAVVLREYAGGSRVFASDEIGLFQNAHAAVRHVFEVAYRRGDEVKHFVRKVIFQIVCRRVFPNPEPYPQRGRTARTRA